MTDDDLPDGLPDDFDLYAAADRERVETDDGTEYVVLVSRLHGSRHLVRADIVDYEGVIEHPMTGGLVGFAGILTAIIAPLVVGYQVATGLDDPLLQFGTILGVTVGAWVLANLVLYRTPIGHLLFRFMDWNDHKHLIVGSDPKGERR